MHRLRVVAVTIVILMTTSMLAACQSKDHSSSTRLTMTRQTSTTSSTTSSSTSTTAALSQCSGALLFEAAVSKEHFDPNDPSYQGFGPEDRAGAHYPKCVEDWAIALISRPDVGTTDGATLFHWEGKWVETWQIEDSLDVCSLVQHDVPQDVAEQLLSGSEDESQQACA